MRDAPAHSLRSLSPSHLRCTEGPWSRVASCCPESGRDLASSFKTLKAAEILKDGGSESVSSSPTQTKRKEKIGTTRRPFLISFFGGNHRHYRKLLAHGREWDGHDGNVQEPALHTNSNRNDMVGGGTDGKKFFTTD